MKKKRKEVKKMRPVDKMRKQKMGGTNGKVIERKKIEIGKQKRIWITSERERERESNRD